MPENSPASTVANVTCDTIDVLSGKVVLVAHTGSGAANTTAWISVGLCVQGGFDRRLALQSEKSTPVPLAV